MRRALTAVGMAAFGALAACTTGGPRPELSTPAVAASQVPVLSDAEVEWHARLLAMTDSRRPDTVLVDSALAALSTHVRRVAALAVGQAGMTGRASQLARLLADADTGVAANAAFALGLLRDSTTVSALARALRAPATVSLEAAWALGEIGAPARAPIEAALADTAGITHLPELLRAAAKLRPVPVSAIARFVDSPDSVRAAAVYALSRSRPPAAVRHLIAIARDTGGGASIVSSPTVALRHEILASAARGLVATAAGDSLGGDATHALRGLARHPHPHVRINALRSLATYGDAAHEAIVTAVRDADANVRVTAAQSAATVPDWTPADWTTLWAADTSFAYRASLLASAAQSRSPEIVGVLAGEWGRHDDWRHRAAYAAALAASPASAARDRALDSLRSSHDPRIRAATLDALADTAAPAASRHRLLGIAATDADAFVRAAALSSLGARVTAAELPHLLAAYDRARRDTVNEARLAALTVIAAAWRRDSLRVAGDVLARLRALPPPVDALERAAGRAASILSHWPGDEGTPRPMAWYEERVRKYVDPDLAGRPRIAEIVTVRGTIVIALAGAEAPLTVDNFVTLAEKGYYTGTAFHRVVPNFVAQDGDPRGDGNGGPGYAIRDELNRRRYARGAVGMALSGPHTGGSQYFLTHSPQPHLDGHYTVFGRMLSGWSALDALVQGDAIRQVNVR